MKEPIFKKTDFFFAPGGNLYDWQEAKTEFKVPRDGVYVIKVTASAQNGEQNGTGDDDDLRLALDGYLFGRKEKHAAQTSWHGFGVAAAWDGASLKGGEKTIHFFAELGKGKHVLAFRADGKPTLKEIEIFKLDQKGDALEDAIFDRPETAPGIKTDENGIPWKSFIFQSQFNTAPFRIRLAEITATCQSGAQKNGMDGDNIKVYVNGRIMPNPRTSTSKKYQNFFFSGDQMQGQTESLMIPGDMFIFSESGDFSIEIWYDETPILERVKFEIEAGARYEEGTPIAAIAEGLTLPVIKRHGWIIGELADRSLALAEEYAQQHNLDGTLNNEADAFRHFTWNVLLTREIGNENAEIATTHHEIFWRNAANKKDFPREAIMDLWNNKQGRLYAQEYPKQSPEELFKRALSEKVIVRNLHEVTHQKRAIVLRDIKKTRQ